MQFHKRRLDGNSLVQLNTRNLFLTRLNFEIADKKRESHVPSVPSKHENTKFNLKQRIVCFIFNIYVKDEILRLNQ